MKQNCVYIFQKLTLNSFQFLLFIYYEKVHSLHMLYNTNNNVVVWCLSIPASKRKHNTQSCFALHLQ